MHNMPQAFWHRNDFRMAGKFPANRTNARRVTMRTTEGAGKLLVAIDKAPFEVPCDFEIKGLSALGSGVDVKFEPFNLLKRAAP